MTSAIKKASRFNDTVILAFDRFRVDKEAILKKEYKRFKVVDFPTPKSTNYYNCKFTLLIKWFEGGSQLINIIYNDTLNEFEARLPHPFSTFFIGWIDKLPSGTLEEAIFTSLDNLETKQLDESPPSDYLYKRMAKKGTTSGY